MSQFFSSDQQVTICYVISKLFNIEGYLAAQLNKNTTSEETKVFCRTLQAKLNKRFPASGTHNKLYAFGAILHPFYRGLTLSQHENCNYREMIELLIKENEQESGQDLNCRLVEDDDDEIEDYSIEAKIRYNFSHKINGR
jgi:hypothetical protein